MLELILSGVMLAPVIRNNGGSCTVDAYINCQMIEHATIVKEEHAPYVLAIRDRIRNEIKDSRPQQTKTLRRLKENNYITSYARVSHWQGNENQIRIIVVSNAKLNGNMIIQDPSSPVGHAMCVLTYTNDYWIVAGGQGMGRGYKGYGLVPKGDANEFYSYTR